MRPSLQRPLTGRFLGQFTILVLALCPSTLGQELKNVLLICVDDLRPELACYGVDYISSPHIDSLASSGFAFQNHYVQAPTCGASRFALLTGTYGGASNGALFERAKRIQTGKEVPASMPAYFRNSGYTTVSVGKVSHHPGGRGGPNWDDDRQPEMPNSWDRHLLPAGVWQHPRGWMHGLANGEIRIRAGEMDVFQASEGDDSIYPDGNSISESLAQMQQLADTQKPFFLAVGILRPHLPFGAPANYLAPYREVRLPSIPAYRKPPGKTTWHGSGEFMKYNRWGRNPNEDADFADEVRKHYAACVSYADAQVGRLLGKLEELKLDDDTIVVLWGDHGWHLGEHFIWGKHSLFEQSLRSPLIIRAPDVNKSEEARLSKLTESVVESIDIFPTLCGLAGLPNPDWTDGRSMLLPTQLADSKPSAISYFRNAKTIRTASHRLIAHKDGSKELYDHRSDPFEETNLAATAPQLTQELLEMLERKLNN
ncbi:MAG: sulfatase [Aureliella sp.]